MLLGRPSGDDFDQALVRLTQSSGERLMMVRARRVLLGKGCLRSGPILSPFEAVLVLALVTSSWTSAGLVLPASAATSFGGVVNTYQGVASVDQSTVVLTGDRAGAAVGFAAGDHVLVIQMTGASPAVTTDGRRGGLGVYEQATVAGVQGAGAQGTGAGTRLQLSAPLRRSYQPASERVQVVRVAGGTGTYRLTSDVWPVAWDGRTGGVVAISAGELDLAGHHVDASGAGFTDDHAASETVRGANPIDHGSTAGRGADGRTSDAGQGGGGVGGGAGAGGDDDVTTNAGGALGGGAEPGRARAAGTDGGLGSGDAGAGGGGGIIGGGGGGGGADALQAEAGAGGGVSGGGGGGAGTLGRTARAGGGGGGVASVGNGADGQGSGLLSSGSGGAGGGSYGGGGGSGGVTGLVGSGSGGGGGGSWTGGGSGGTASAGSGGAGNAAVTTSTADPRQYLDDTDPHLMLGGAGGRGDDGSSAGGAGGGIVVLDTGTLAGDGSVLADGDGGTASGLGVRSGSGGGGGGQITISGQIAPGTTVTVRADGGAGARGTSLLLNGPGASGGGGGGGGIGLDVAGAPDRCAGDASVPGIRASVEAGTGPSAVAQAKKLRLLAVLSSSRSGVGAGSGGRGLICTSSPPTRFALGDLVWRDDDADGLRDAGEPGLSGVPVTLLDSNGDALRTVSTDTDGRYLFDDLPAATYRVRFGTASRCSLTLQAAGDDPAIDSDPSPYTGLTPAIALGADTAGLRSPVAADGTVTAARVLPVVDAGEVCSTTSTTLLGAYTSEPFTDVRPGADGSFGGVGTAVLSARTTSASVLLKATGLPVPAGGVYGAQVHFGPCVTGDPDASGQTYNISLLDGDDPPVVSAQTEIWLDLRVDSQGRAIASATVPFVPSAGERSIVLTSAPTVPGVGESGTRLACLPLVIG